MPLRSLFPPSNTAVFFFDVSLRPAVRRRHHSSLAAPSFPWAHRSTPSTLWAHFLQARTAEASAPCCSSPNHDPAYWHTHRAHPHTRQALLNKFHEIEQLYRGNVEYVKRMREVKPGLLQGLAFHGQKPPFMLVDCSDSRVNEQSIFDAEPGTMFTAGNIANMFDEEDPNSHAVLSYAVETLKVKHVVVLGHYGCGGVAASMAPLPPGYEDLHLAPPSTTSNPGSTPADLAVQKWILPIRRIYQSSSRTEIRAHRERITRVIESGALTSEEVAARLMGGPPSSGFAPEKPAIEGMHLRDPAFRALVEENVKANVWRLMRSRVIRDHHKSYIASLSQDYSGSAVNPIYVHGWVYDLENGVVNDLNVSVGPPGWIPPPGGVHGGFPCSLR